jgi:hypothetical protein
LLFLLFAEETSVVEIVVVYLFVLEFEKGDDEIVFVGAEEGVVKASAVVEAFHLVVFAVGDELLHGDGEIESKPSNDLHDFENI